MELNFGHTGAFRLPRRRRAFERHSKVLAMNVHESVEFTHIDILSFANVKVKVLSMNSLTRHHGFSIAYHQQ